MQLTVLLISSEHFNWIGLRVTLQEHPDTRLVGEERHAANAVHEARKHQPDVILITDEVADLPLVAVVRDLRLACPASKLIVVGDARALDTESLRLLAPFVAGYLLWEALRFDVLSACLRVAAGLVVGSPQVIEAVLSQGSLRHRAVVETALTYIEQSVLYGLATGLTQREIAIVEHVSEATVERIVAALRAKFGVSTTCALCTEAGHLGFVVGGGCDPGGRNEGKLASGNRKTAG